MKKRTGDGLNVYQRSDGQFVAQYRDDTSPARKWREKRIPTAAGIRNQREAEAWARDWNQARLAAVATTAPMTLGQYVEAWLKRRAPNPNIRKSTLRGNKSHAKTHIVPKLGSMTFPELTPAVLRDWLIDVRDTPRVLRRGRKTPPRQPAPYSVRNIAATLRSALDDAYSEGLLPANPMRSKLVQRELPAGETRAGADVVVHLVRGDAERLLTRKGVPDERKARYAVGLLAGLRDGEISALTWADVVDIDGALPHLTITKAVDTRGELGKTKTRRGVRKVPLHPIAAKALRAWRAGGWVELVGHHARPTDPVFPNAAGETYRPRSAALIRADLEAAGCATTYGGHAIDFHATRRSFATWLEEAEVPEGIRKRLMGHGGAGVTDESYTAKTLARLAEAVGRIGLDLSAGKIVELPLKVAAGADQTIADDPPFTAELTAPLRYDSGETQPVPGRCGWDSNPRVMVLQTIA